ncbi:MAG: Hypothetical protein AJITA_00020 [Acetilactobacillus jinshanensis]
MIKMKKFLILIVSILILMCTTVNVSAHRARHVSHRTRIIRLYRHAYYELRHHHSYKRAFHKLYRTESKYHYSYTFRPKAHHKWN